MPITFFPSVESASEDGLVAIGGDYTIESLLLAYKRGIFPWPHEDIEPIMWFSPDPRAILEFKNLRINKRLKRYLKKENWTFRVNQNFESVITFCQKTSLRKNQTGTWITEDLKKAYIDFYKAGFINSFETYDENNNLIGGMYGVRIDHFFAGESMFSLKTNASKFTLIKAIEYLSQENLTWMDIQMMSPLLESFGAVEINRSEYVKKLKSSLIK